MNEFNLDISDIKKRMSGALASLKNDFLSLRTGRASSSMLDPVVVEVYGSKIPLNQCATVTVPESRVLSVNVWDVNNVKPFPGARNCCLFVNEAEIPRCWPKCPKKMNARHGPRLCRFVCVSRCFSELNCHRYFCCFNSFNSCFSKQSSRQQSRAGLWAGFSFSRGSYV